MARFKYRMQSILDIKMKLENQAKQDFGAAKAALDLQIDKLDILKQRKLGYENEAERLLQGELKIRDITDNKAAILRMEDYIRDQKEVIKKAEAKLEEARLKLQQVVQERKMHEKLKEKAFDDFLEEEKHSEGKEVDQLTSYKYGQQMKKNSSLTEKKGEDLNG